MNAPRIPTFEAQRRLINRNAPLRHAGRGPFVAIALDATNFRDLAVEDLRAIGRQLRQPLKNNTPFVRLVKDLVGSMVRYNFSQQEGPNYNKWAPLAKSTKHTRQSMGLSPTANLLIRSGDLLRNSSQHLKLQTRGHTITLSPDFRYGNRKYNRQWRSGPFKIKFAAHNREAGEGMLHKGEAPPRPFFYWRHDWNVGEGLGNAFLLSTLKPGARRHAFKLLRIDLLNERVNPAFRDWRMQAGGAIGRYRQYRRRLYRRMPRGRR